MQHWKIWIDHEEFGIPKDLYFDKLLDGSEGLQIFLKNDNGFLIRVTFLNTALCFRKLDEDCYLRTLFWLKAHPEDNFIGQTNFVVVQESEFLKWFHEDSLHIYDNPNAPIPTYVILTDNEIVEIISETEPLVEIV